MSDESRRFPPPWSVDDPDMKLGQDCYVVRDANGHALAYVYFEDEPGTAIGGAPDDAGGGAADRGRMSLNCWRVKQDRN
jgi:hypothetical protein